MPTKIDDVADPKPQSDSTEVQAFGAFGASFGTPTQAGVTFGGSPFGCPGGSAALSVFPNSSFSLSTPSAIVTVQDPFVFSSPESTPTKEEKGKKEEEEEEEKETCTVKFTPHHNPNVDAVNNAAAATPLALSDADVTAVSAATAAITAALTAATATAATAAATAAITAAITGSTAAKTAATAFETAAAKVESARVAFSTFASSPAISLPPPTQQTQTQVGASAAEEEDVKETCTVKFTSAFTPSSATFLPPPTQQIQTQVGASAASEFADAAMKRARGSEVEASGTADFLANLKITGPGPAPPRRTVTVPDSVRRLLPPPAPISATDEAMPPLSTEVAPLPSVARPTFSFSAAVAIPIPVPAQTVAQTVGGDLENNDISVPEVSVPTIISNVSINGSSNTSAAVLLNELMNGVLDGGALPTDLAGIFGVANDNDSEDDDETSSSNFLSTVMGQFIRQISGLSASSTPTSTSTSAPADEHNNSDDSGEEEVDDAKEAANGALPSLVALARRVNPSFEARHNPSISDPFSARHYPPSNVKVSVPKKDRSAFPTLVQLSCKAVDKLFVGLRRSERDSEGDASTPASSATATPTPTPTPGRKKKHPIHEQLDALASFPHSIIALVVGSLRWKQLSSIYFAFHPVIADFITNEILDAAVGSWEMAYRKHFGSRLYLNASKGKKELPTKSAPVQLVKLFRGKKLPPFAYTFGTWGVGRSEEFKEFHTKRKLENREEKGKIGEKEEEDEPKDASLTTTRSPVVLFEEDHPPTTATGSSRTAADVLDHTKQIFANAEDILAKVGKISAVTDKKAWKMNWDVFTDKSLNGLDWSNVFCAGGAVLACSIPSRAEENGKKMDLQGRKCFLHADSSWEDVAKDNDLERSLFAKSGDVDLFLYDLTRSEANKKLVEIEQVIQANSATPVLSVKTEHAVTFVQGYPKRHIQVVLRLYSSPAEVLLGFDLDASCVGYDGSDVWLLPRAIRAINLRTNTVDLSRRSLSYESRLAKYATRGFSVTVPTLNRKRISPQLFDVPLNSTEKWKNCVGLAKLLLIERARSLNKIFCCHHTQSNRNYYWNSNLSRILSSCHYLKDKVRNLDAAYEDTCSEHVPHGFSVRTLRRHYQMWWARQVTDPESEVADERMHNLEVAAIEGRGRLGGAMIEDSLHGGGPLTCDYSNIFLPFKEGFDVKKTAAMLKEIEVRKECAEENFDASDWWDEGEEEEFDAVQETTTLIRRAPTVRHGFSVAKLVLTKLTHWVTHNPGRQILSGSFHPVSAAGWDKGVYVELEKKEEEKEKEEEKNQELFVKIVCLKKEAEFAGESEIEKKLRQRRVNRAVCLAFPDLCTTFGLPASFGSPTNTSWNSDNYQYNRELCQTGLILRSAATEQEAVVFKEKLIQVCENSSEYRFGLTYYFMVGAKEEKTAGNGEGEDYAMTILVKDFNSDATSQYVHYRIKRNQKIGIVFSHFLKNSLTAGHDSVFFVREGDNTRKKSDHYYQDKSGDIKKAIDLGLSVGEVFPCVVNSQQTIYCRKFIDREEDTTKGVDSLHRKIFSSFESDHFTENAVKVDNTEVFGMRQAAVVQPVT